ncbi:hypothetical protein K2W90_02745 [Candidatus Babeliales bacterium]|nr:hypothetical protein [Candidatus Babeliales bacterium]
MEIGCNIRCNKCDRKMGFSELLSCLTIKFLKEYGKLIAEFLVGTIIKEWLLTSKRSLFELEGGMASCANYFDVKCPKCESLGHWDPAPEEEKKVAKKVKTSVKARVIKSNLEV